MSKFSVIFAGFGGQGVLFMGKVMAYIALFEGKEVTWMPSYGPEMRGGTANCTVCISDMPIGSPVITNPDALVAMSAPSYNKFAPALKKSGTLVYDDSTFTPATPRVDANAFALSATALAGEQSLAGMANMILLGKLLSAIGQTRLQIIQAALAQSVPSRRAEMVDYNLRAIQLGMDNGR